MTRIEHVRYAPPEVLTSRHYSFGSDAWAIAITLIEVRSGKCWLVLPREAEAIGASSRLNIAFQLVFVIQQWLV